MRSYSHLSEDERDQIGVLRAAGRSMGSIARALGRGKATISRELQRNALHLGGYSPLHAAGAYQLRSCVKRRAKHFAICIATLAYRALGQSSLVKHCVENALSLIVASGADTHWDKPLGDHHSNHENPRPG